MKTLITPEKAAKLLENNTINRKLNPTNLGFIRTAIENGTFLYNGESIIVAKTGELLNGQHRLQACVDSGISITVSLVEGIEKDAMSTIDTGKTRGGADVLHMNNVKNAATISSAIRLIIEKQGKARRLSASGSSLKVSNAEILEFYNGHQKEIDALAVFASHAYRTGAKILTASHIMAYIYLLSYEDKKMPIMFMRELMTGASLTDTDIVQMLRTKLINNRISKNRIKDKHKVDLIVKIARVYFTGERRKTLRVTADEDIRFMEVDVRISPKIDMDYLAAHSR